MRQMKKLTIILMVAVISLTATQKVEAKTWMYTCKNCKAYTKSKIKVCKYCKVKGTIKKVKRSW